MDAQSQGGALCESSGELRAQLESVNLREKFRLIDCQSHVVLYLGEAKVLERHSFKLVLTEYARSANPPGRWIRVIA
jgi:hypothetical protein